MTRLASTLVTFAICAIPLACGGSTRQDASAGGSAGVAGSGATAGSGGFGATAGSGGGGAGGSGATAGAGGSGATVSCADFEDESSPGTVTLRIKNERSTPIYLGGDNSCSPEPLFDLVGPKGPVQMNAGGCGNSCQALQQHGDWCMDACLIPPVVVIDPGGSYDTTWSGTTFESQNMPTECYFEPQLAPTTCDRRVVAQSGAYGAVVTAATALICNDVALCDCTPSAQGSCEIPYGAALSGTTLAAKTSFELPGASLVVITFQ